MENIEEPVLPRLESLPAVNRARVFLGGRFVAELNYLEGVGVVFDYTVDYLMSDDARPIASTLPLSAPPLLTPGRGVPVFFGNLLPEGHRFEVLRKGISLGPDDLSMLLAVGSDLVGDVQVLPYGEVEPGEIPDRAHAHVSLHDLSLIEFKDLRTRDSIRNDRVGLAGAQMKTSAKGISATVYVEGKSHILKMNPPERHGRQSRSKDGDVAYQPHVAENEAFFYMAARMSKVKTAHARLVTDASGERALLVERFDRHAGPDGVIAYGVEDGCQASGLEAKDKYGPVGSMKRHAAEDILGRLVSMCTDPYSAAEDFLRQVAFAYVSGNNDAHPKNFGVVRDEHGFVEPCPAYDLPSSYLYGDDYPVMSVQGCATSHLAKQGGLVKLGESLGLRREDAQRIVHDVANSTAKWLPAFKRLLGGGEHPLFDQKKIHDFERIVVVRRDAMLRDYRETAAPARHVAPLRPVPHVPVGVGRSTETRVAAAPK